LLEFRDLACSYGREPVLLDINLRVEAGQMIGLVGPSGCGKTTLLRAALGLLRPVRGQALFDGRPLRRPPARVGYVPQLETVDWTFPVTVEEVVLMGRTMELGPWPWASARARAEAHALLERLDIGGLAGRHIRELSGGQQQRVFLARALLRRPQLLLLDEPTTGVDIRTRHDILHLLAEIQDEGTAIMLTTHELNAVATHLPYLVCLNRRIVAQGPPERVFTDAVLSEVYGGPMHVVREGDMTVVVDHPGVAFSANGRSGSGAA
jgi:zinc/manganese transport system ATP-binding protein/zinc transport system ATP-binding protein